MCESLTSVTIPDSVASIRDMAFYRCESLTSITIPNSVTSIGKEAFSCCRSLTSITIPDSVIFIGDSAFNGCKGLADKTGLVIVRDVLYSYEGSAKRVEIPGTVTSIGSDAFYRCKRLISITIPNSVTSIGDAAFRECESLTNVTIPDSVTSIEREAFSYCKSLTSVTIPDSVTDIGHGAFIGCESLKSVTIFASVASIDYSIFYECANLEEFTCPDTFASLLPQILPATKAPIILHIPDISGVGVKFRPGAAVGFAEDNRDCADENGKKYVRYIKANAVKLAGLAMKHPALLHLMIREKLIAAKDLEAVTKAVRESGDTELMAAILDYGNSAVSEKDKARVKAKKQERETDVINFVFDAEKLETLKGKRFVVTGRLKTFASRDELKECLTTSGAALTETLAEGVDYLITNAPDSDTAKNRKAMELGIERITEDQFNEMIGRTVRK